MKIVVTGANGYIGCHVVKSLCDLGYDVLAIDFKSDNLDDRAKFSSIDILNRAEEQHLYQEIGQPEVVIHLAWQDGFNHNAISHLNNLAQHYNFIKNMIDSGCPSISVMGTMHEIGYWEGEIDENTPCNPLSLYGVAKNALRQLVFAYADGKKTRVKWLRAYYITGDDTHNKSIFAKILQMENEGKTTFPFTTGANKYDFIEVEDLAKQITKASVQNEFNGIINCCTGKPISLKDKVEAFITEHHLNIRPEYGVFPTRKYDSPAEWGNAEIIKKILG